jgi:hypothetical protein
MIYIAKGALSVDWQARDVVWTAATPFLFNFFARTRFRGTIEEHQELVAIWNRNEEAHHAVVEALGMKLYWLIEQNVPTERTNRWETDADPRYYQAVCNALADIVRDTKIIHDWREYKLDRYQYERDWELYKLNWVRALKPGWEDHRPPDWEMYKISNEHPATREARLWYEAATALQKLIDSKKRDPTVRDYPEVDLPEFELAASWVCLLGAAK